jgi:hypothetical protein
VLRRVGTELLAKQVKYITFIKNVVEMTIIVYKEISMKIFIVFLLTFSIFADFSSSIHEAEETVSNCDSYSVCQDVDFHDASTENNHSDDCEHCHCHAGHVHTAFLETAVTSLNPVSKFSYTEYPVYLRFKVSDYNSEVIRPPIA